MRYGRSLIAVALIARTATAQSGISSFHMSPWAAAGVGTAVLYGQCTCTTAFGGPALDGVIGAGLTVTPALSVGLEETGFLMYLADSRNTSRFRMFTAEWHRALGPLSPRIGVGAGRYTMGEETLVKNRLAGQLGLALISRLPIATTTYIDVLATTSGPPGGAARESQSSARNSLFVLRSGMALRFGSGE